MYSLEYKFMDELLNYQIIFKNYGLLQTTHDEKDSWQVGGGSPL